MIPEGKKLILFDGVCNLCNSAIQYIIKKDKNNIYVFAALQSTVGEKFIQERNINTQDIDSIILVDPDVAYYIKSSAALHIAYEFGKSWKFLKIFEFIPSKIRDLIYDFVAKNRYKWYGKKDACMIPTPELKSKFID